MCQSVRGRKFIPCLSKVLNELAHLAQSDTLLWIEPVGFDFLPVFKYRVEQKNEQRWPVSVQIGQLAPQVFFDGFRYGHKPDYSSLCPVTTLVMWSLRQREQHAGPDNVLEVYGAGVEQTL